MEIGYSYLLNTPKDRRGVEIPLKDLDLAGLRAYMCPISHGDYARCRSNCQSLKHCPVGQMVMVRLDERDRAHENGKWEKVLVTSSDGSQTVRDVGKQDFLRAACVSGNAWNYVMEKTGQSKDAAKETLLKLIRKYPGVAAEYGGSRRIMQRPKSVTTLSIEREDDVERDPKASTGDVAESVPEDHKEPERVEEAKSEEPAVVKVAKDWGARKREEALALYRECLTYEDPRQHYVEIRGSTLNAARVFFCRMDQLYGEGNGKKSETVQMAAEIKHVDHMEPKSVMEEEPEMESRKDAEKDLEDDTISLADFLSGFELKSDQQSEEETGELEKPDRPEEAESFEEPEEETAEVQESVADVEEAIRVAAYQAQRVLREVMDDPEASRVEKMRAAEILLGCWANVRAREGC